MRPPLKDPSDDPVSTALRNLASVPTWPLPAWEHLVRYGRRANLLGRIAVLLQERHLLDAIAPAPRAHLQSALVKSDAQAAAVRRELVYLERALAGVVEQVILLKGAAYLAAGLPPARGRLFSDIDILVPHGSLPRVEAALMLEGWATTHHHPYDQRYYRRWMHELPPMRHVKRLTVLDVHHTILPVTARLHPDPAKLFKAARPVNGLPSFGVLAAPDMVLHSATHLFHNEELDQGLRDLADLDALLRHFSVNQGFWTQLIRRAAELELSQPLSYALRYVTHFFETPVPPEILHATGGASIVYRMMDELFLRALRPDGVDGVDRWVPAARKCLYVRAHWLRMPPWLLAYHLTAKMFRREETPAV